MPPDPLISVIVPAFNAAGFLGDALASVLSQSTVRQEIIVIDDGSTDETARLPILKHPLITLLSQTNQGPASARNAGLNAARGEWLAFLDADDIWPKGRQERLLTLPRLSPSSRVVQGRLQRVGRHLEGFETPRYAHSLATTLFHREVFNRVGLFDPRLRFSEDLDFFLKILEQGLELARVHDVVLYYRQHADSMTHGQTSADMQIARVLKQSLDRRRRKAATGAIP